MSNLITPIWNKYIKITPSSKQQAFLLLDCLEAFYGGAAGGGKSVALLASALQYVDFPSYNAILIRDTYKNLTMPDSLMDLAFQWLNGTDAHWQEDKKRWTFPSGATLSFGYLDGPRDHFNFQSAQFQFVGIDEAVNIRENQALYLFSRLRKVEGNSVPIRFRCASNPPAREQIEKGEWVKKRYVDRTTRASGAIYVPAGMNDNPFLNKEEYRRSLKNLDPITRKQLEEGDWEIKQKGRMFDRTWFEIVGSAPPDCERVRFWDMAATEKDSACFTAGVKIARDKNGVYYIESIIRTQKEPLGVEQLIRQTADMDGQRVRIAIEQEPGSSGKNTIDNYRRRILPDFAVIAEKVSGSKFERAMPFSSQAEAGNIKVIRGHWNNDFFEEVELFPDSKYKDQVDACTGAYNLLSSPSSGLRVRNL